MPFISKCLGVDFTSAQKFVQNYIIFLNQTNALRKEFLSSSSNCRI